MGRPVTDLTNKKCGLWTVLSRATPPVDGCNNALWNVRCVCGTTKTLPSRHLTDSRAAKGCHKCGVRLRDGAANKLTGRVLGSWTVLERVGTCGTGKNRKSTWRCSCPSEHTQVLSSTDLKLQARCRSCAGLDTPTGGNGALVLTAAEVAKLYSPLVYMWRLDMEWLYIGSSAYGVARVFDSNHTSSHAARLAGAELHLILCASHMEAQDLEKDLIHDLKPRLNKIIPDR